MLFGTTANPLGEITLRSLAELIEAAPIYYPTIFIATLRSPPISDKGSLFVASGVAISDVSEVASIVNFHANKDSKHRKATHHMYAYRLLKDGIVYHDNADDGEDGAGRKIAELLANMMKADATANERQQGVVLIVSRWYGGTLLGPKRFAHIASAAREVMLQMGYGCRG